MVVLPGAIYPEIVGFTPEESCALIRKAQPLLVITLLKTQLEPRLNTYVLKVSFLCPLAAVSPIMILFIYG